MKNLGLIFTASTFILFQSCKSEPTQPFDLMVGESTANQDHSYVYNLSESKLIISELGKDDVQDSIVFSSTNLPQKKVNKLSNIDLESLGVFYSNPCAEREDVKVFRFTKNGTTKQILLRSYYHKDLSVAVELINELVPSEYRIIYNKNSLLDSQRKCDSLDIQKTWGK